MFLTSQCKSSNFVDHRKAVLKDFVWQSCKVEFWFILLDKNCNAVVKLQQKS